MNDVQPGYSDSVPPAPVFAHAVASFEPTATSVILWTRLTGAQLATWVVAADADMRLVVASGDATASPENDWTVRVDVTGLEPASTYWYRFEAGGETSPLGRTRTMPADDSPVRIGIVCCGRYSYAPLSVYRALAEVDVDLVLHLGDYIYEDDGHKGPREHEPPHTAVTLDDYRTRIAQVRRDEDAQALHLRHPMVTVWDDHDLADNAWRDGAKAHDPREHGSWVVRRAAAATARAEWLPGRNGDPLVTWRAVDLGGVGELLLLDTRIAGREQHAGDEGTSDLHDPMRSMLGNEQRAWLDERLADVSKPWALIASSVVVSPIVLRMPGIDHVNAWLPNGYAALDGVVMHDDQWDGYPAERAHLVSQLAARGVAGGRAVVLSGDVHASWAFEGPRTDGAEGDAVAVEITCPSTSSAPFARNRMPGISTAIHAAVRRLPHVHWSDLTERGFVVVEVTRDDVTAEFWFADADDPAPSPEVRHGTTVRCERLAWPPFWSDVERLTLKRTEPDSVPVLPPRPADIASIRRARRVGRAAMTAAAAVASLGAATVAALWNPFGAREAGSRGRLTARR